MLKYIIGFIIGVFIIFMINAIRFRKNEKKRISEMLFEDWGKFSNRNYDFGEYEKLTYKFKNESKGKYYVDDITWNDLDMDNIFKAMNNTKSSAGEEYLYKKLRIPEFDEQILLEFDEKVEFFMKNKELAIELQREFLSLGRTKKISLSEFLDVLSKIEKRKVLFDFVCLFAFIASIAVLFIKPVIGIIIFIIMLVVNIGSYYKELSEIDIYFKSFKYLIDMIYCSKRIVKKQVDGIEYYNKKLKKYCDELDEVVKGSFLVSINGNSGSIIEVLMEYIRMLTHIDLIKFSGMVNAIKSHNENVSDMFEILGMIEAEIAIASFKEAVKVYCKPKFVGGKRIEAKEVYHPLIKNPVTNDFCENGSVLITGSNASGKSTFLKTIATNIIFAQTFYFCVAKSFVTDYYRVYTSMSLRDSLSNSDSYFMVEIKSIKRIIDSIDNDKYAVACFIDEVLRGTNTIERIAASSHILENISKKNAVCYAATHDVELTNILENSFANYHFTEEVKSDDVRFSYKIMKGRAQSRNAIKLLGILGFEKIIINKAENMAENFLNTGDWNL